MTNQFYGQLDLTKIAALVQQQPELVKKVNFRDGEHMLLPINVNDMQRTDEHGNTHSITAYCRKDDRKPNLNYFIANLKPSNNENAPQRKQPTVTEANQMWGNMLMNK